VSEPELVQALMGSAQVVVAVFSMFFTICSAYIAGLFFFLNRAPFSLRLLAFFLLSVGLVFLGGSAMTQQRLQEQLFAAWAKLPAPAIAIDALRSPLPMPLPGGALLQDAGVVLGWATALCVYLALAYLTFLHRWQPGSAARGAGVTAYG
jgi:hypothetical protein